MKYKDFIRESKEETDQTKESHKTVLTKEKAIELIKSKCDINNYLYRGYKSGGDYLMFDGSKGNRVSRDSSNHHNIILDHLFQQDYNEFALRSKSTICTTDRGYASNFGDVYRIFPFIENDISIMGGSDMFIKNIELGNASYIVNGWNRIFENLGVDNKSFSTFISDLTKYWDKASVKFIKYLDDHFGDTDYDVSDVIKLAKDKVGREYFNSHQTFLNKGNFPHNVCYLLYTIFMYADGNLKHQIEKAYDPYVLGMDTIKVNEISKIKGDQEVWFSGKCVAIKESLWREIEKDL